MRTVVITGATSGFGILLTKKFLEAGDRVVATGRELSTRPELFQQYRASSVGRLFEFDFDVTNSMARIELKALCERLGGVDILINNAGFGLFGALESYEEEQIRYQMEVNFFGTVFLTQELLPLLRLSKGKIFNFSSLFGMTGFPLSSVYCASKFAIEGFSEALALELGPHGPQVCCIQPGGYRTKFSQNSIWGKRSGAAAAAYQLQTENYKKLQKNLASRSKFQNPQDVADRIFALAQQTGLPLKVPMGRDARVTGFFKKLIPEFLYQKIVKASTNRIFLSPVERGTSA